MVHHLKLLALLGCAICLLGGLGQSPALAAKTPHDAPVPFLYRPYYGTAPVLTRSASLFDHDGPNYVSNGTFTRYDGQVFHTGGATGCQAYVNCYDGHNGYDLNMVFEPVLASAAGTVIRASWFNPANHLDGGGLWVAIDHGMQGGIDYVTMYCHLSAILVNIGQQVPAQWQIGTSGSTGSASGPHLHFTVFQMPRWQPMDPFGWRGTQPDPNSIPDYYLWVGNPTAATQTPCLACGDNTPRSGATITDDASTSFSATGAWQSASGAGTIGGGMRWTATVTGAATATATWHPTLPSKGWYEVGAYVDPMNSGSQWAPYTITSLNAAGANQRTTVWLDQMHIGTFQNNFGTVSTGPQWVSLGTYLFDKGASVTLSNATGENGAQLGADALEFVPVSGGATVAPAPTPAPTQPPAATATPAPTQVPGLLPPSHRGHP